MKIHIFGASGSGVTTLGNALANKLNIPYFDSDDYFWEVSDPPFTKRRAPDQRNQLVKEDLQQQKDWILGGSIINWGPTVFPTFDLIVFLWIPSEIRIERLKNREEERYGTLIFTDPERNGLFNDFIAWAKDYDEDTGIANRTLNAHQNWLKQQTTPILTLKGDDTIDQRIEMVLKVLVEKRFFNP